MHAQGSSISSSLTLAGPLFTSPELQSMSYGIPFITKGLPPDHFPVAFLRSCSGSKGCVNIIHPLGVNVDNNTVIVTTPLILPHDNLIVS